jgi:hypothetical protein
VRRLLRKDLFSGWGIRSLSAENPGYDPLGYHVGCVWPHDTAIAAEGMRRYGFRDEASRLARALLEAATAFEHRLPEVFSGRERDHTDVPVPYPDALAPQAWAAAAPLLALRTLLGLDVVGRKLRSTPARARRSRPGALARRQHPRATRRRALGGSGGRRQLLLELEERREDVAVLLDSVGDVGVKESQGLLSPLAAASSRRQAHDRGRHTLRHRRRGPRSVQRRRVGVSCALASGRFRSVAVGRTKA